MRFNYSNTEEEGEFIDEKMDIAGLAIFMQGMLIVTSTFLSGFFVLQKLRNRCSNEVIYVSLVMVINYSSKILAGKSLTWVTVEGGSQVPLGICSSSLPFVTCGIGRYFSWLLTCPVILIQMIRLHACVGYKTAADSENFLVLLDQIMIVCGSFGAVSQGPEKWIFFVLGLATGSALFGQVYLIVKENYKNFPFEARGLLSLWTGIFLYCYSVNQLSS